MFKRRKNRRRNSGDNPLASRVVQGDDRPTEPLEDDTPTRPDTPPRLREAPDETRTMRSPRSAPVPAGEEPPTRLVRAPDAADNAAETGDDLPVATLLVIRGPGRGSLLPVGAGMNNLGRGAEARIRVDFGDTQIARERHAVLTYDPEGRRFYLQHGGGSNLSYRDGQPVLEPVELADGARLRFGATEFLFRVLVGPHFDWPDAT